MLHLKQPHSSSSRLLTLALTLLYTQAIARSEVKITNVDDFLSFANAVNNKTSYSGATVLLSSDLSFSGKTLEPIGKNMGSQFTGTFDGQGHIISDLKMSTSVFYTGLFGYSRGVTIKNVVLDSSCSMTISKNNSRTIYLGGVIGYCHSSSGLCNIENSINMADVTYGMDNEYLFLGGIAGYLQSSGSYAINVKNCANYGTVTKTETSYSLYIGGIVGCLHGSYHIYILNSINYGAIVHNGKISRVLYLGGIMGSSTYANLENCVSAGKITSSSKTSFIGSVVGFVNSHTSIAHCYYADDLDEYAIRSSGPLSISECSRYDSTTFELSETVSVNGQTKGSLIDALNSVVDCYPLRDYSKWLLNKDSESRTFTINGRGKHVTINSKIILLPSLTNGGSLMFNGWYTDNKCTTPLESFETTKNADLYSKFEENTNNYTITFDTRKRGVHVAPRSAQFGTNVLLPSNLTSEDCTIAFWENEYGDYVGLYLKMPARDFTLYGVWKCTHITTTEDFVSFSKVVNTGITYSGTTVFLDSDLSFSNRTVEPVGKDHSFLGTFDGQGHVISNLKTSSSSYYTGLFGYSEGLTIRNVVIDSSCSIANSDNDSNFRFFYAGRFIGTCYANKKDCVIENSVNMADITFSGNSSYSLYVGGIAGYLYSSSSSSYGSYLRNCANYGSITYSGSGHYSYIGGIVASFYYYSNINYEYVRNCVNHGAITHSGTTSDTLYIGGIMGWSYYTHFENCVSAGKISMTTAAPTNHTGSIVGYVGSYTYVNYCYYTNDVGEYAVNGTGTFKSMLNTPQSPTTVDSTLINELNKQIALEHKWNRWLLNKNNASTSFILNNNKGFSLSSQLILFPDPIVVSGSLSFNGWYTDIYYYNPFQSDEVLKDTILYGLYGVVVTVSFDANGGNVTLSSNKVSVNNPYGDLPTPTREGYMFMGWFTDDNENVINEAVVKISSDHTLHARWEVPTTQVEITFEIYNMTKEDVEAFMKKYVDEGTEFTIVGFSSDDETGETKATVKFGDIKTATTFVEDIKGPASVAENKINEIKFVSDGNMSLSSLLCPLLLLTVTGLC